MRSMLRCWLLLLGCFTASILSAQTFTYVVSGVVVPCAAGDSVHLEVSFYTEPSMDTVVAVDPGTCTFTATFTMTNDYPHLMASVPCNNTIAYADDSTIFSFPDHVIAYDTLVLDCGGVPYDCSGVAYGTHLPGTPCDDGNPTTSNDLWQADCSCIGDTTGNIYDCLGIPYGPNMPGSPCDDGDSLTTNDTWTLGCACQGGPFLIDCNGVPLGPAVPGTLCDDGDPQTVGDVWTASCICIGYTPYPCSIHFQVIQAAAYDSITANTTPIPNTLWASIQGNGAWPFQYSWDFGDGSTSSDPYPMHTYAGDGPYNLCVTITDAVGCSATTCDSVSVDPNGWMIGMVLHGDGHSAAANQRSGFTIQVLSDLPSSVDDPPATETFELWPNPATDRLDLRLGGLASQNVNIRIIDINGRTVMLQPSRIYAGLNFMELPIQDLPPGIYLLRVENGRTSVTKRFVKL